MRSETYLLKRPGRVAACSEPPRARAPASIIFGVEFEVGLGMIAGRTFGGGFGGLHNPSAVAAFPQRLGGLLKDGALRDRLDQRVVASLMPLFNRRHLLEDGSDVHSKFSPAAAAFNCVRVSPARPAG